MVQKLVSRLDLYNCSLLFDGRVLAGLSRDRQLSERLDEDRNRTAVRILDLALKRAEGVLLGDAQLVSGAVRHVLE